MGAKSTVTLTRHEALRHIHELLEHADNDALADALEALNDAVWGRPDFGAGLGLANFHVVGGPPQEER